MKQVIFILSCTIITLTSCDDFLGLEKRNKAQKFVGEYHGQDVEDRKYNSGIEVKQTYNASVEIYRIDNERIMVNVKLCYPPLKITVLDMEATIDPQDSERFLLEKELFINEPVSGETIEVRDGYGKFVTNQKNLELRFKEIRTINSLDPMARDLEYTTEHVIQTNQVNTGEPEC